ncbi:PREDICTED: transmembrane protein 214-A isoform X2 [Acromyrmex echinatior]|uniref:transmembrane protein 214-A isoform X2 n=1 Tax=Acromyrmex echinatior TaxID=103372 RepID=UPI000580BDF9|nr:PREDICTED: transmembrane protein 214-A isoform X2 [Acromyrmex echinatior]
MSSGSWELVRRKKDRGNDKSNKLTKAEKKKFIENAPKVEDFLPLSQVKTLYDNLDGNKENKKPAKAQGKEHKTKENEEKKKQHQKQQHVEKKKSEPKEKPPKTVKDALNAIDPQELDELLATAQVRFPDAPLLWLKELNAFLNIKIPINKEDAIFSGKPKDYPLSLVPKTISSILERAVEMTGQQTIQIFYENTLTTMATDMVKGIPVIGHKIFLQLLAHLNPEMTAANILKLINIRNSYENRKNIGLSLLWAWSQAGKKNFAVGLKIWHEVMSPMLETKSYASYVVQILNDLVFGHDNVHDLSLDLYLSIIMDTYSQRFQNIQPANLGKDLSASIDRLRSILFRNKDICYTKLFEMLMGKVSQKLDLNYRNELIKVLADCLVTEPVCFTIWNSIYTKNLYQSSLLLSYIETNLPSLQTKFKAKHFKETLGIIQNNNEKWKKAKDENLALTCKKTSQALLKKMTSSSRGFPWRSASLLLLLLIGAIVAYDTQKHGSFKGHKAVKDSSPEYYKAVVDLCAPYIKLAGDSCLIVRNLSIKLYNNVAAYVERNVPIIIDTIEHYAPGILEQIKSRSLQGLEFVKVSFILIGEKVIEHSSASIQWLEKNVFVGKLSPDNLRNYAIWAFDTTQSYAAQTYDWVYEKVQTLSKVP